MSVPPNWCCDLSLPVGKDNGGILMRHSRKLLLLAALILVALAGALPAVGAAADSPRAAPTTAQRDAVRSDVVEVRGFGGALWNGDEGVWTILATSDARLAVLDAVEQHAPGTRIDVVHSERDVAEQAAVVDEVTVRWPQKDATVQQVEYDPYNGVVVVKTTKDALVAAAGIAKDLAVEVEVPIRVEINDEGEFVNEACTSRYYCSYDFRGGVRISAFDGGNCTMGFHVYPWGKSWDGQFLTSGHCGPTTPNYPVYQGSLFVGDIELNAFRNNPSWNGFYMDVARVDIVQGGFGPRYYLNSGNKSQLVSTLASDSVIAAMYGDPDVCKAGLATGKTCGTQYWFHVNIWDSTDSRWVTGNARYSLLSTGGDSGAPVYRESEPTMAMGVHRGTTQGWKYYVRISPALGKTQATLYKG